MIAPYCVEVIVEKVQCEEFTSTNYWPSGKGFAAAISQKKCLCTMFIMLSAVQYCSATSQ